MNRLNEAQSKLLASLAATPDAWTTRRGALAVCMEQEIDELVTSGYLDYDGETYTYHLTIAGRLVLYVPHWLRGKDRRRTEPL